MEIEELKKKMEEQQKQNDEMKSQNERLQGELSSTRKKAEEAESKISASEKEKLEEQGKYQELLTKEREENAKIKLTLKERTNKVLKEKLKSEALKYGKDICSVDMLLKLNKHTDLLKIDEESLEVSGMEEFVSKARETDPYLFEKKSVPDTEQKKPSEKDANKKPDLEEYYEKLKIVGSQKELDELRKKYGQLE